ncbi:putative 3-hydroxyphenylpropionic transporter MhpT [Nocardia otitidiscaviarum]|uniref:Putative 3-hydroxyphenylpropionic transporter MhpT n=1 Tax=Nocardia otitidiscaviarum TaxID=1823 RepID=A0A378Y9T1_9NOCA|nr:MFS transporter [Nocardia otitidiscaviarum]SUA73844.1 putative 3-hydroxyphenylpropionic transporter MhpT [Nocardia otitidiscaviarum]
MVVLSTTLRKSPRHPDAEPEALGADDVGADDVATRWIWLAAWPVVAVFVLSNAATPLYVLWQRDLGFSRGTMTVIFACYIAGLLGSLLVSGVASDRIGRRPVLVPALLLALTACLMFATASTVAALMIARLLTGIAVGAAVSAGMAAVTDIAGPGRTRLAALLASTAMVFGAGLGPLLAGVLSETLPAPTVTVFAVEAALLATALLVVARMPLVRTPAGDSSATHTDAVTVRAPGKSATTVDAGRGSAAGGRSKASTWMRVPRVPRGHGRQLGLGIAVFAPGITATSFVLSLGPALLSDLLGTTSRIVSGAVAFAMFLTATGVQFAVRALPRRRIMLMAATGTVCAMVALALAVHLMSVVALLAAALCAGAGQGLGQLGGLSLLNAAIAPRRLAEANAALNVGGYLPAGLLPVSAGYLSDALGLAAGATVFAAVVLVCAASGGVFVARAGTD